MSLEDFERGLSAAAAKFQAEKNEGQPKAWPKRSDQPRRKVDVVFKRRKKTNLPKR